MGKQKYRLLLMAALLVSAAAIIGGYAAQGRAADTGVAQVTLRDQGAIMDRRLHKITQDQREAAADRLAAAKKNYQESAVTANSTTGISAARVSALAASPLDPVDYFGIANWANSPPLKKFIDPLPMLPVAVPDTETYKGSDYYELSVQQYAQKLHSELPPTTLRGYVQTNNGTDQQQQNTVAPAPIQYLGPLILAQKDRPVRIKFTNELGTGTAGDLFVPVDTTVMGAGAIPGTTENFTQNRAVLHLHGGKTPWISDGTPHQWITPKNEVTSKKRGDSAVNVPDMPDPGEGAMTYYYPNQQSARLLWIHDHSWGITRLNVYVGMAMGYLLTDPMERQLVSQGIIPPDSDQIPLIIQDKTFVAANVRDTDPNWNWGTGAPVSGVRPPVEGDLWYPHVYVPAQNPYDVSGVNPWGRWPYGPWFWPPTIVPNMPVPNPYFGQPGQPEEIPGTPHPSAPGESFHDTIMVNGAVYPTHTVQPKPYRLRILNASNDRFWNLQWYLADSTVTSSDGRTDTEVKMVPAVTTPGFPPLWPTDNRDGGVPDPATCGPEWIVIGTEGGFLPEPVVVPNQPITWNNDPTTFNAGNVQDHSLLLAPAERADVIVDFSAFAGKTLILYNDAPAAFPALDARYDYYTGAPDMTDTGGHPGPQAGFGPNVRTIMQIKIGSGGGQSFDLARLQAAFKTTGAQDGVFKQSQDPIIVGQSAYNSAYNKTFPTTFPNWGISRIQDTSLSFQTINDTVLTIGMKPKAIQDEMGEAFDEYGRLNSKLGLELAKTTAGIQTFILQNYVDPATEVIEDCQVTGVATLGDGTQIWKITHNGVDTHPVHFHLYDVQLLNRVGWDGAIRLPHPTELGWKETVRISPLEDTIVALRAVSPKLPFGVPDSKRLYNPNEPQGSTVGFSNIDPVTGQPLVTPIVNDLINFGWEYVWHCHILSHEEMDMMRPVVFNVARQLPDAPDLSPPQSAGSAVNLTWTDGTPQAADGSRGPNWGNPKSEVGFRIERSSGGSAFAKIGIAPANQTTYSDQTVGNDTYFYRVIAFNAAGETASNDGSVTTSGISPSAPSGLTATAVDQRRIDLAWVDTTVIENGFRIERSTDNINFSLLTNTAADAAAFSDTTVGPAMTYYYRVYAYNTAGLSLASNTASATTPPEPPTPPAALTATAVSAGQVNLAWTDTSANETGFTIERADGAGAGMGAFGQIATVAAGVQAYSDTTAAASTTYTYRVIASNTGGVSAPSNTASATTLPNPPSAPSGLTATAVSAGQVNLAWTDTSANETGFIIERATGAGAFGQIGTVGPNVAAYSDTTVAPATAYSYRVTATNSGGNSAPSNTATATTPEIAPAAPSNLTVTAGGQMQLNLTWSDQSGNEAGFRIERSADGGAFAPIGTVAANATAYSDTALAPATTYSYRVIAFNAAGDSAPSNTASGTTLVADTAPAAPTGLTASVIVSTSLAVSLNWQDNSNNESGFTIQRSTNVFFLGTLTTYSVGANVTSFTDTAISVNTTYFYRVRATNNIGSSAFSNAANVRTPRSVLPAAPTDLQVTGFGRFFITLAWIDNAANEQGFYLERSTAGADGPWTRIATVRAKLATAPSSVTYMNLFLARGTDYWYRVQAYNAAGGSAYSNVVSATTLP